MTKRKDLAEAIYRIDPFNVAGRERRAIDAVTHWFRESSAPEFMLQNLMDELAIVAHSKARSRTKDKEVWQNISDFLKKADDPMKARRGSVL